ncbi:MAG: hypothetical protein PVH64_11795 [Bacillota bacterium]|jgi:hypothetical protein
MLAINPTEELTYYLMHNKRISFHFGEISLGVQKLLDALKNKGYIVYFKVDSTEPVILSNEDCRRLGITFEHQIVTNNFHHNEHALLEA